MNFLEITHTPFGMLVVLFACHYIVDFALQNEWVAVNKSRHSKRKSTDDQGLPISFLWPHLLTAHSFQHGFFVMMFTQNLKIGVAEIISHWITDYGKCEGWFGFHVDQIIHLVTKVLWVAILFNYI